MKIDIRTAILSGGFAAVLGTGIFIGQAVAAQPHMQDALDALRTARSELNLATHNKGGHRVRALEYVNSAISEVERGMDAAD